MNKTTAYSHTHIHTQTFLPRSGLSSNASTDSSLEMWAVSVCFSSTTSSYNQGSLSSSLRMNHMPTSMEVCQAFGTRAGTSEQKSIID